MRSLSTRGCGQHAKQNMIEDDENSVYVNEVGFVLLPEKFQNKKPHSTLSKLKTVTGKRPQMSEKEMKKQMFSQLHNQKKGERRNSYDFSNELCSSGLCFRVRQNYKI